MRGHPLVVLMALVIFVATTIRTGVELTSAVTNWYTSHYRWRAVEEDRLEGLRAGYALSHFEAVLGTPLFEVPVYEVVEDGDSYNEVEIPGVRAVTFRGRGHWVVATVNKHGTVAAYVVTVCDSSIQPAFRLPAGGKVVVNRSTVADVHVRMGPSSVEFFFSGATANSYYYEFDYGGNPENYQDFGWGLNDACTSFDAQMEVADREGWWPMNEMEPVWEHDEGSEEPLPPEILRFREHAVVNTFIEVAPLYNAHIDEFDPFPNGMPIGVDRLRIRGFDHESE